MKNIFKNINFFKDNLNAQKVLIIVIGITIFFSVIGISWSFFSAIVTGNEDAKVYTAETATLSITYDGGNELKVDNILPGWTGTKSFSVTNTGDVSVKYNISWSNITNTFTTKKDFVYSVSSDNSGGTLSETNVPATGKNMAIIENATIASGVTQHYTVSFKYINRNSTQNDQGKKVEGKIVVDEQNQTTTNSVKYLVNTIISKAPLKTNTINKEGLMKVEQDKTGQTSTLTEYRYSGNSVKNYVTFNEEVWRIIGVFSVDDGTGNYKNRVRIIKESSIDNKNWNDDESNDWTKSSLKSYLNEEYYNKLSTKAKNQIDNVKWYINPTGFENTTAEVYQQERGTTGKSDGEKRSVSWIGKVALLYPSDYGYASSECYRGSNELYYYDDSSCKNSDWLYKNDPNSYWLLSPRKDDALKALYINSNGNIGAEVGGSVYNYSIGIRPVVHLKTSVTLTGGKGTIIDPYIIK